MQGAPVSEEFAKLLTGEAALEAIATADACTQSMFEDRKVKIVRNCKINFGILLL